MYRVSVSAKKHNNDNCSELDP